MYWIFYQKPEFLFVKIRKKIPIISEIRILFSIYFVYFINLVFYYIGYIYFCINIVLIPRLTDKLNFPQSRFSFAYSTILCRGA